MAKGQPSQVTQTNKVELTPEQRELMAKGMGQIDQSLAGGTPQLPGVQGFDPLQNQAQQGVINKQGSLQQMSGNLADAQSFMTKDVMNMESNPYMRQAIDAAVRPMTEQFQQTVIPGLRTNAIGAGALGSPKARGAGQIAANQFNRSVGDVSGTMANQQYGMNLEAMIKGMALAPQSMQASLFPEIAMEGVGAQRRQLAQDQATQGFNQQMLPFNLGTQLISAAAGAPGAGSTSTVTGAEPKSNWTQLLGSGVSAAAMLAGFV